MVKCREFSVSALVGFVLQSLGCTLYAMCFYESPFDTVYQRGDSVALAVISGIVHFPDSTMLVGLHCHYHDHCHMSLVLLFMLFWQMFVLFNYDDSCPSVSLYLATDEVKADMNIVQWCRSLR